MNMGGGYCRRPPGADEGDLGTVRGGCSQNHHLPGEFSDNFLKTLIQKIELNLYFRI